MQKRETFIIITGEELNDMKHGLIRCNQLHPPSSKKSYAFLLYIKYSITLYIINMNLWCIININCCKRHLIKYQTRKTMQFVYKTLIHQWSTRKKIYNTVYYRLKK